LILNKDTPIILSFSKLLHHDNYHPRLLYSTHCGYHKPTSLYPQNHHQRMRPRTKLATCCSVWQLRCKEIIRKEKEKRDLRQERMERGVRTRYADAEGTQVDGNSASELME